METLLRIQETNSDGVILFAVTLNAIGSHFWVDKKVEGQEVTQEQFLNFEAALAEYAAQIIKHAALGL